jgi:hypothetical protein
MNDASPPRFPRLAQADLDDVELCRRLASITPWFVETHVAEEDRLMMIDMIRQAVPGYGPH